MKDDSFAASLPDRVLGLWRRATDHPFMRAVADGTVTSDAFDRWIRQDFLFVVGLKAFVRDFAAMAPDEDRAGLDGALAVLDVELDRFRDYAYREDIDLGAEPLPACADYLRFLGSCLAEGYAVALSAYFACERAYLESWARVRTGESLAGPYAEWVDNWSSQDFRTFVEWLGERLDASVRPADIEDLGATFERTVSHEVAFWDACWSG